MLNATMTMPQTMRDLIAANEKCSLVACSARDLAERTAAPSVVTFAIEALTEAAAGWERVAELLRRERGEWASVSLSSAVSKADHYAREARLLQGKRH